MQLNFRVATYNAIPLCGLLLNWLSVLIAMPCEANTFPALVPPPHSVKVLDGPGIELGASLQLVIPVETPYLKHHMSAFADALYSTNEIKLLPTEPASVDGTLPKLIVKLATALEKEEYRVSIREETIEINASTVKGVSRATSTLLQLIGSSTQKSLPAVEIKDKPSCMYRSFMVDLGRNPHSLECLKETIDLLWFYKVDSFHLHLTDDQRFAFPSRRFPKLVSQDQMILWDEFKELDRYAQTRGISIIPELEVPGHSGILVRQYPEVFGKSSTDVAKLPSALTGIKTLLDEMIEVFESAEAIHIGGDEAFGVPEELQRDLINTLHAYLAKRGKKTIVWEGPRLGEGDNKVHEDVIHINWRTINFPADQMLKAGYPVVNAAWDPLYLVDHYPRNNFTMVSPKHIFTTLKLRQFKHVNPGIPTYHNPVEVDSSERLIGFCMPWWEGREENYLPMSTPRIVPMGSVAWNHDQPRDYEAFSKSTSATELIRKRCFYPVSIVAKPLALQREGVFYDSTTIELDSAKTGEIYYTLDGSLPTANSPMYNSPIEIDKSCVVRARLFEQEVAIGHASRKSFLKVVPQHNLALGKPVTTSVGDGPVKSSALLTDGGTGNLDFFLGYPCEPDPIEITVDLGKQTKFDRVVTHAYFNGNTHESHAVQISNDGETFETVSERWERPEKVSPVTEHVFAPQEARYIRILSRGCKGAVFDSFSKLTEIQVFLGTQN